MKISRLFCGRFLSAAIPPAEELAALLTARGLEVEAITPVAVADGIIAGNITACAPHPSADKLQLCTTDIGADEPLTLVCGAPNARAGLRVAVAPAARATLGAVPMQARAIRGVTSAGMICSAAELGIGADKSGIVELLAADGDIGDSLQEALLLNDHILEINITPNRGDCLSHLGIAREVAAAINCAVVAPQLAAASDDETQFPMRIDEEALSACPYYGGLVVRACDGSRPAPWALRTLIERCGGRSVSAVVDITNYVMLALGQPLHAFDLDKLHGGIRVRYADEKESLTVLDGSRVTCTAETLLIADDKNALALAGVMGGADSGITAASTNILLEGAHFIPGAVAGLAQRYKLNSDAAFRFERGVDAQLPAAALTQAAAWIKKLCGGTVGQLASAGQAPAPAAPLMISAARVEKILGIHITAQRAGELLSGIGLSADVQADGESLKIAIPSWRFDIKIAEDIIEEIVRLHGYDNLPETMPLGVRALQQQLAQPTAAETARAFFSAQGFYEIISYAFVSPAWEAALSAAAAQPLANPMSEEMSVMRTTLWGGLLDRALFNSRRRQERLCLFEVGRCFLPAEQADLPHQPLMVGGLMQGLRFPAQWAADSRMVDFYDIKGVVEMFLAGRAVIFKPISAAAQPGLHPEKAADVYLDGRLLGTVGELHPACALRQEFKTAPFLFALDLDAVAAADAVTARQRLPVSRFPLLSRDVALIADAALPVGELLSAAQAAMPSPPMLEVCLFDFYNGDGERVAAGKKSCGLRFLLQGQQANLTGEEIEQAVQMTVAALKKRYQIELREQ